MMRFYLATLILLFSQSSQTRFVEATPKTDDDVSPFIYGGEDAQIGEFPYYVYLFGCGGALIAPDMVLSAAHCRDRTGQQVVVGAYNRNNLDGGAQVRTCEKWIANPWYGYNSNGSFDSALCKLDAPVTIDETKVKLVVNRDTSFELANKDLTACGLGYTDGEAAGLPIPTVLQRTTLRGMSDAECEAAVNRLYGSWSIELVCADGNRQTDVCRGDSGGPLVRIEPSTNGGPDLHYHIGAVSYGKYCPEAETGVYARTSEMASWIDEVMCQENSVSKPSNCPNDPNDENCTGNQSTLVVKLTTDDWPQETAWTIQIEGSTETPNPVRFTSARATYSKTVCLEPNTRYVWTITDTEGDGLCYDGVCGSFFLTLNGEEIFSRPNGDFESSLSHVFLAPSDPGGGPVTTSEPTPSPTKPPTPSPTKPPTPSPTKPPTNSPTRSPVQPPGTCSGDESELFVKVKTDNYPDETGWVLERRGNDGLWIAEESRSFDSGQTEYEVFLCLDPNTDYRWTITDTWGDGMCYDGVCGSFLLTLNGEEIFSRPNGDFGSSLSHEFQTPTDPDGGGGPVTTSEPTPSPTKPPTPSPTKPPTPSPTKPPTPSPTKPPTPSPTKQPTPAPTTRSPTRSPVQPSVTCSGDESELFVKVKTDNYPLETRWVLERQGIDGLWIADESRSFDSEQTEYEVFLCLDPNTDYRWVITDSAADGLCFERICGYFFVMLNGIEIISNPDGIFSVEESVEFTTPGDPDSTLSPTSSPTPLTCGENEAELIANIVTDAYPSETAWFLEISSNGEWITVEELDYFPLSFTNYVSKMCLQPDTNYRWTITDYAYDGLCYVGACGSFQLTLGGTVLLDYADGVFEDAVSIEFTTQVATARPTKNPKNKKAKRRRPKNNKKRIRKLF